MQDSDFVSQLEPAITNFANVIKTYKTYQHVEIELRVGILEGGKFKPGLSSVEFFTKVKQLLDSNKNWTNVSTKQTNECISGNIRQIGKDKHKKEKLYQANYSFENTPYDFRISVSTEIETKEKIVKNNSITRDKLRHSYTHSDFRFDLTRVIQTQNKISEEIYELEIELLNLNNEISDFYRGHSALLKLRDIINCCENISTDCQVQFINEDVLSNFKNVTI